MSPASRQTSRKTKTRKRNHALSFHLQRSSQVHSPQKFNEAKIAAGERNKNNNFDQALRFTPLSLHITTDTFYPTNHTLLNPSNPTKSTKHKRRVALRPDFCIHPADREVTRPQSFVLHSTILPTNEDVRPTCLYTKCTCGVRGGAPRSRASAAVVTHVCTIKPALIAIGGKTKQLWRFGNVRA